jgi:hypothetical protein
MRIAAIGINVATESAVLTWIIAVWMHCVRQTVGVTAVVTPEPTADTVTAVTMETDIGQVTAVDTPGIGEIETVAIIDPIDLTRGMIVARTSMIGEEPIHQLTTIATATSPATARRAIMSTKESVTQMSAAADAMICVREVARSVSAGTDSSVD